MRAAITVRGRSRARARDAACVRLRGVRIAAALAPGATGILTLRCQEASNRWEEIWKQPRNQTLTADLARQAS